eukprot:CAMPEP_0176483606 /NCGR_PEP_ID=MMETSP0200_2-20121128/4009_1 /TAXON_ID=947934 /ORGANISM="Chaetoceros sp., Strain GSL56" /LENGTH=473 /DNA_ID=CAMNT_0017880021 /DNA_START=40 /DNA_END=1458 /DNA_ORIENTATION=+
MKRKLESKTEPPLKDTNTTNEETCPLYGSQEYWDQRYKKNFSIVDSVAVKEDHGSGVGGSRGVNINEEASPGFSWYFTYQELKPLLLPLVLGSHRNEQDVDDDNDEEEGEYEYEVEEIEEEDEEDKEEEEEIEEDGEEEDGKDITSNLPSEKNMDDADGENDEEFKHDIHSEENQYENGDAYKNETIVSENANNEIDQHVDSDDDDNDNGDEDDDTMECEIDPNRPPRKVLEIGCGDVPLGEELCKDILKLGEKYDMDATQIVDLIICFDYVQCCIDVLRENQEKQQQQQQKDEGSKLNPNDTVKSRLKVEYKVHDARYLPYKNDEFHVIIDKGTLDAVLSDKFQGKSNCIKILSEAARILSPDNGYIIIVSHLNANEPDGMAWLHEVLVPGLSASSSGSNGTTTTSWKWKIEVHGNDCADNNDHHSGASSSSTGGKYGPAVYIIQKRNPLELLEIKDNNDSNNDNDANLAND